MKKNELKPWQREPWCLPKKIDVSVVAALEEVLTVYEQRYDEDYPQVCLDEKLVTLHGDVVEPLPLLPGCPERIDYE
jgi:hypothetical protein